MKKIVLTSFSLFILSISYAQLPDILPENPSKAHIYFENQGQLIDNTGQLAKDVLYYTTNANPQVLLGSDKIMFSTSYKDTTDSAVIRLDMSFVCSTIYAEEDPTPCTDNILTEETSNTFLNYYYSHCPNGITNVTGHQRIIYENAFDDIDIHMYSNEMGLKSYIVIRPNANPNDILFQFDGQDSINISSIGNLTMYLDMGYIEFPQATAYEIDANGQATVLSWLPIWNDLGNGQVNVSTFAYNSANTLVIKMAAPAAYPVVNPGNMKWSTHFGDDGRQVAVDIEKEKGNDNFFVLSEVYDSNFEPRTGTHNYVNGFDMLVSKFNTNQDVIWSTHIGSDNDEYPVDLEHSDKTGYIYIAGNWNRVNGTSDDFIFPANNSGNYIQSTPGSGSEILLFGLEDVLGQFRWGTFFGGSYGDVVTALEVSDGSNDLIMVGETNSNVSSSSCIALSNGNFPICGLGNPIYLQSQFGGNTDGFISYFTLINSGQPYHGLKYSTYFGGTGKDIIYDVKTPVQQEQSELSTAIYFTGSTDSPNSSFPLAQPLNAFNQGFVTTGKTNGFIGYLNASTDLVWSTYVGSNDDVELFQIEINEDKDIYFLGVSNQSTGVATNVPSTGTYLPIWDGNQGYYSDLYANDDLYLMKFNTTHNLEWSTFYGSDGTIDGELLYNGPGMDIVHDEYDNIYIYSDSRRRSSSGPAIGIETKVVAGAWNKDLNLPLTSTDSDPFLLMFNNTNDLKWATYVGGNRVERAHGIEYNSSTIRVAGGTTSWLSYPVFQRTASWWQVSNPSGTSNASSSLESAFITEFLIDEILANGVSSRESNNQIALTIYPNPVSLNLNLFINISSNENGVISIKNSSGQKVKHLATSLNQGFNNITIDVSSLSYGAYYISLDLNSTYSSVTKKFVKIE